MWITDQWNISSKCWRWNRPCQVLKDRKNRFTEHERFRIPVSAVKIETMKASEWVKIIMLDNKILMRVVHTSSGKTLDWISWQRAPVHVPVSQLGILTSANTCTSSLTLINTHLQTHMEQHTSLHVITEHLLSIPTQSVVIQKALSELTSSTLESPSSFFHWLQLSVAMWAKWRLIALPLTNEHISYIYAFRDDGIIETYHILCTQMLHVVCFKGWMTSTPQTRSCIFIFTISSNDLCQGGFDSWRLSSSCFSGLHIVVGMSSFCFSEYQLEWVVSPHYIGSVGVHAYTQLL